MSETQDPVQEAEAHLQAALAAKAPAAAAAAFEAAWPAAIGAWLATQVANSPIAQSTPAYNHLVNVALPALRQAILENL